MRSSSCCNSSCVRCGRDAERSLSLACSQSSELLHAILYVADSRRRGTGVENSQLDIKPVLDGFVPILTW